MSSEGTNFTVVMCKKHHPPQHSDQAQQRFARYKEAS
jgi:hypothetical protein